MNTIEALFTFLESVQRNVDLFIKVARILTLLLSTDLSLEMNKVILSDQGTNNAMMMIDMSASTSHFLLYEPDVDCIATNLSLMIAAASFCKTSNIFSEEFQTFQKLFVMAVSIVCRKTHVMSSNVDAIYSSILKIDSRAFATVKEDLLALIISDFIKKMDTKLIMSRPSDGSYQRKFNGILMIEFLTVCFDLSEAMQLYLGTHFAWSKLGGRSDSSYLLGFSSSMLNRLKEGMMSESGPWTYRLNILLAMREVLSIETQLETKNAEGSTVDIDCSRLEKVSCFATLALKTLKQLTVTSENANEVIGILCQDTRILSQLLTMQGSLHYPAKLLEYMLAVYVKLSALPLDEWGRAALKDLEQVCLEVRLGIRVSQVFTGLYDTRDIDIYKSCFSSYFFRTEPLDKKLASCSGGSCELVAMCESFVLLATNLIHSCESSLHSKLSSVDNFQQLEGYNSRALEELVSSLLEQLNRGEASLGIRLTIFVKTEVCLTLAKLLHLVFNDVRSAYRWVIKALSLVNQFKGFEMQRLRIEAFLLLIDLCDQVGASDFCNQYVSELLTNVNCFPSQSLKTVVKLHLLRVWYRQKSNSFKSTLDKFPTKRNNNSIDDTFNRIVDVVNLIRVSLHRTTVSPSGGMPRCLFRYAHLFWNFDTLCSNSTVSLYHSYLPPSDRKRLLECISKSKCASTVSKAILNKHKNQRNNRSATSMELNQHLLSCLNFDVVRTLRRQLVIDAASGKDASFRSFVAAASSCCVFSECSLDVDSVNSMPKEIGFWSDAITSVLMGGGDRDDGCSAKIRSRLMDVLQRSKCDSNRSASVCVAVLDEASDSLFLGRMDQNAELIVSVPLKTDLVKFVTHWHTTTTAAGQHQMYDTTILEKKSHREEQHIKYWRYLEDADQFVKSSLQELQKVLGPWRILLCGQSVGAGAVLDGCNASLQGNVGRNARIGAKRQAESELYSLEMSEMKSFLQDCRSWIDFVLLNTDCSAADAAAPLESGIKLTRAEAEVILVTVAQSWNNALSVAAAQQLAGSVLSERYPEVISASQLVATDAPADNADMYAADSLHTEAKRRCIEPRATALSASVPSVVNYSRMSAEELKNLVKRRGLKPRTTKSLNIKLLIKYDAVDATSRGFDFPEVASTAAFPITIIGSVLLILDETLQCLPWECLPCLRSSSCSRMPGLALLLANPLLASTTSSHSCDDKWNQNQKQQPSQAHSNDSSSESDSVSVNSCWTAVDISDNLKVTRTNLENFLLPYTYRWEWKTFTGVIPTKEEVKLVMS